MKVPRDLSGAALIQRLRSLGYEPVRQTGSHVRLKRTSVAKEHNLTVPNHDVLKLGTLNAILADIADSLEMTKQELIDRLFG